MSKKNEAGTVLTVCGTVTVVAYLATPLGWVSSLIVGGIYGVGYTVKTLKKRK